MQGKNGKEYPDNVGFAYKDISKKGVTYLSVTLDLAALGLGEGTKKLIGFITPTEQIEKGNKAGKKVPHVRFIVKEDAPANTRSAAPAKSVNKSELPF